MKAWERNLLCREIRDETFPIHWIQAFIGVCHFGALFGLNSLLTLKQDFSLIKVKFSSKYMSDVNEISNFPRVQNLQHWTSAIGKAGKYQQFHIRSRFRRKHQKYCHKLIPTNWERSQASETTIFIFHVGNLVYGVLGYRFSSNFPDVAFQSNVLNLHQGVPKLSIDRCSDAIGKNISSGSYKCACRSCFWFVFCLFSIFSPVLQKFACMSLMLKKEILIFKNVVFLNLISF